MTASLDDPDLSLDFVVAYTELLFAIGAYQRTFFFWTPRKALGCFGWWFIRLWWRWCSRRLVAQVKGNHIKVE